MNQGITLSGFYQVYYPKVSILYNIPRYLSCIFPLVLTCIFALHLSYQYPNPRYVLTMNVPCPMSCNGPCQPNIQHMQVFPTRMFLSMYKFSPLPQAVWAFLCKSIPLQRSTILSLKLFWTATLDLVMFSYHELSRVHLGFMPPRTTRDYAT